MTTCYLRMGSDYLEDAERHNSIKSACDTFQAVAQELARFDQCIGASIHIANSMDEVAEYPDFVLSLGPRGGLKKGRA